MKDFEEYKVEPVKMNQDESEEEMTGAKVEEEDDETGLDID